MTEQEAKDRDATINEMVNALGRYATTFELQRAIYDAGWNAAIDHAVVKAETCKWVNGLWQWSAACGSSFDEKQGEWGTFLVFDFCPNCGGKIVERRFDEYTTKTPIA